MTVLITSAWLIRRQLLSLSGVGLMLGALFFAAALTPTLIPRSYLTQGVLAGGCFALGYLSGVLWRRLWHYLELPEPSARARSIANALVAAFCLIVVIVALWRTAEWQNSIRTVMKMAPVETAHPLKVCAIALITFMVLLVLGRLFALTAGFLAARKSRVIRRKIANVIGVVVAALLFWSIVSNVLIRAGFNALDSSFREVDALLEPERPQPTAAERTGSPASLVKWTQLGRMGRRFIASSPTAADISAVTGRPARDPVRVYVGLGSRDTAQARARLALEELKRQHGFERKVLIVITPTGTGWIDPSAMDTVEYLHHGDVASVAMQYSYLNSPLSLLFQPEYGAEASRALFAQIYGYWTTLPKDARPKLYLHGLSLGALNSENPRSCSRPSAIPLPARCGAGRRSRAASGARSPPTAIRARRRGCRNSATAVSSAS